MKNWEFLEHTADVQLKAEATTLKELYLAALLGMNEVLRDGYCDENDSYDFYEDIVVQSLDPTTLLIDFLSEILTLSHLKTALFCKVNIIQLTGKNMQLRAYGNHVEEFYDDIKAVTYHAAEIVRNPKGNWECYIIFDI